MGDSLRVSSSKKSIKLSLSPVTFLSFNNAVKSDLRKRVFIFISRMTFPFDRAILKIKLKKKTK